jgi:hypothetical protein
MGHRVSVNGTLPLGEVRAAAAAALAPPAGSDLSVHVDYPDAVEPPALVLIWAEPWLEPEPRTIGYCQWTAHLLVRCVASRVEPGPAIDKLEELVAYTIGRMQADAHTWPAGLTQTPRLERNADIPLLTARVAYDVPVTI